MLVLLKVTPLPRVSQGSKRLTWCHSTGKWNPLGRLGIRPHRFHGSAECFCSSGFLSCDHLQLCQGHAWSTGISWCCFLWFLLPRCITDNCSSSGGTASNQGLVPPSTRMHMSLLSQQSRGDNSAITFLYTPYIYQSHFNYIPQEIFPCSSKSIGFWKRKSRNIHSLSLFLLNSYSCDKNEHQF